MSKVHIVISNQYALPVSQPGIHRHAELARHLTKMDIRTTVVASDVSYLSGKRYEGQSAADAEGTDFRYIPSIEFQGNSLGRLRNMLDYASKQQAAIQAMQPTPTIIVGSSPSPFSAYSAFKAAQKLKRPFLYEVRDPWPLILRDIGGMPAWHPLVLASARIERILLAKADCIVALYPGYASYVQDLGFGSTPLVFVPNGVNPTETPAAPLPERRPFRLVYTGAHGAANGLHMLLDGLDWVARTHPERSADLELLLIGDGGQKPRLKEMSHEMGLTNVTFCDPVTHLEVLKAVRGSHAGIVCLQQVPSLRLGPSPNKLFDYMLIGRPVLYIADTDPDPVAAARCGVTVREGRPEQIGRALLQMADAPPEQLSLWSANARRYVEEHHALDRLAAKFAEAFDLVRTRAGHA
jgi:glycosyltransferase involved in cell wall biosynthesis